MRGEEVFHGGAELVGPVVVHEMPGAVDEDVVGAGSRRHPPHLPSG